MNLVLEPCVAADFAVMGIHDPGLVAYQCSTNTTCGSRRGILLSSNCMTYSTSIVSPAKTNSSAVSVVGLILPERLRTLAPNAIEDTIN